MERHEDDGVAAGDRRNGAVERGEIHPAATRDGNQMRIGDLVVGDHTASVAGFAEHESHVIHDELVTRFYEPGPHTPAPSCPATPEATGPLSTFYCNP